MRFKTFFPLDLSSWTGPPKKYSCLLFQALNSKNCWQSIGVTFILGCKLRWQCKNSNSHMNWALLSCTRSSGNCSSSYYYILRSSSTNNNVYSSGKTFMHCITPGTLGTEKGLKFLVLCPSLLVYVDIYQGEKYFQNCLVCGCSGVLTYLTVVLTPS